MKKLLQNSMAEFTEYWWGDQGLSVLLLFLVVAMIVSPLITGLVGELLSSVFLSFLLVSGVATVSTRWHLRLVAGLVAGAGVSLEWLRHLYPANTLFLQMNSWVTLMYFIMLTTVVMGHVFGAGKVNGSRVRGAMAAYILVGFTWSFIYRLIEIYYPGSFNLTKGAMDVAGYPKEAEFNYFSFVTLTTLGYGDITPAHPIARIFVIIEALIGQLYPATLLARLVSLSAVAPRTER